MKTVRQIDLPFAPRKQWLQPGGKSLVVADAFGGRIAVMTTYGRESLLIRKGLELGAEMCGVRVFDRTTVPCFFAAAGLTDIDQQLRGISQFVMARRPERASDPWLTRSIGRRAQGRAIGF